MEILVVRQDDHFSSDSEFREAGEHEGIAFLARGDYALFIDVGGVLVVGEIERQTVHIARGSVRVVSNHLEWSLGFLAGEDDFVGNQGEPRNLRSLRRVIRSPVLNPLQQRVVIRAVWFKPAAARVRYGARRLEQPQALLGRCQVDPATHDLLRQTKVVTGRIISEQAKVKAIFSERGSVAASGIASGAKEYRHHV